MSSTVPWPSSLYAEPPVGPRGQRGRRLILETCFGPRPFDKLVLEPGQSLLLGRDPQADGSERAIALADPLLSRDHCRVLWNGEVCQVVDLLSAKGTFIEGLPKPSGMVPHGSWFKLGNITLLVHEEAKTPPPEERAPEDLTRARAAFAQLSGARPLYAILDAARDPRVRVLLRESIDEAANLYEGVEGRTLDEVAPYLVAFDPRSGLLERLVGEGWGRAWGVFFTSNEHKKEVRRHLRRFLMVQEDTTLERLYFRYYDPRVLREFLPIATPRQRAEMTAGFERLFFEGEAGEVVEVAGSSRLMEVSDAAGP